MNWIKTSLIFLVLALILSGISCKREVKDEKVAEKKESVSDKKGDDTYKVEVGTSVFKGPADAPVTIINFSDFQCPFSKRSVDLIEKIMKEYDGKVRYVFKHFPLGFHKLARPAALASIAAHNQGKFWEYYGRLFEDIKKIDEENLSKWAVELGLDMEKFNQDRNSEEAGKIVQNDMASGSAFGVRGTPTLFINGKRIVGANGPKIQEIIIAQIAEGEKLKAKGVKDVYSEITSNGLTKYVPPKRDPGEVPADIFKVEVPAHAPVWGNSEADVTMVLIDDFECPFCARLHTTYEQIKKEFDGKIRIAFVNLPLRFHKKATPAAMAAMAAHQQDKFWDMYDVLFKKQKEWKSAPDLQKWFEDEAKLLELDMDKFKKDMESAQLKKIIADDMAFADDLGVRGTPATFVNGRFVNGALPFEAFKKVIEEELEKVTPLKEKGLKGNDLYLEIIKNGSPRVTKAPDKNTQKADPDKIYDVKLTGLEPVKGSKDAQITIIEFSEFQCPFCRRGAATIEEVVDEYKGKVKLVFKHMPLAFHKEAKPAALFSIAVKKIHGDELFFAVGKMLFEKQSEWKADHMKKFENYSKELNLDWKKISKEMQSSETEMVLKQDMDEASKHGVRGVPAFFINGKMVSGAKKKEYFKAVIDNMLKKDK